MKKIYYVISLLVFILALGVIGYTAHAQEQGGGEGGPGIRARIRSDIQVRSTNAKNNADIRNTILQGKGRPGGPMGMHMMNATSTHGWGTSTPDRGDGQGDGHDRPDMMGRPGMMPPGQLRKTIRKDEFANQKNRIVEELKRALNNLKQVRERISSRIAKAEQSGRNMTEPKKLLVTADAKITAASQAIDALSALGATSTPPSGTGTSTPPDSMDLTKPRAEAQSAENALRDAQKALNAVVVSIAHNMGLKVDLDGHIQVTATTTATTTTP